MQAFTAASNFLAAKYLPECTLYVTVEPCVMCAGASYWTHIGKIVIGTLDEKRGYASFGEKILHPKTIVKVGVLAEESKAIMQAFFLNKRAE